MGLEHALYWKDGKPDVCHRCGHVQYPNYFDGVPQSECLRCEVIPETERIWEEVLAEVAPRRVEKEPGRNDPCPCGSGKKYKKCHGR